MFRPHVRIDIQLGLHPGEDDRRLVIPIDEYVVRHASERLDFPSDDAPVAIRMFVTTPPKAIHETQILRKALADAVAARVRERVLSMLGENDTEMGYKRDASTVSEVSK